MTLIRRQVDQPFDGWKSGTERTAKDKSFSQTLTYSDFNKKIVPFNKERNVICVIGYTDS